MAEAPFQEKIENFCDWLRLLNYHVYDSRRDKAGFPDLVIVGPGGTIFAELKSTTGKVSAAQQEWHTRLNESGATAYVWRPEDWDDIERILKALARKA